MSSRCRSVPAPAALLAGALCLALAGSACEREERRFHGSAPAAAAQSLVRQGDLQPGPATRDVSLRGPYEDNAFGVSEGKRLYNQFNCSGCHFQGGGGIGPPLMDAQWIYGSAPENIYATIVQGRPNGMPSFAGKLGADQVWQIVAYVRSMSGLLAKDVASGRSDQMQVRSQEQSTPKALPKEATPKAPPASP